MKRVTTSSRLDVVAQAAFWLALGLQALAAPIIGLVLLFGLLGFSNFSAEDKLKFYQVAAYLPALLGAGLGGHALLRRKWRLGAIALAACPVLLIIEWVPTVARVVAAA